jgi:hypothetical protein
MRPFDGCPRSAPPPLCPVEAQERRRMPETLANAFLTVGPADIARRPERGLKAHIGVAALDPIGDV